MQVRNTYVGLTLRSTGEEERALLDKKKERRSLLPVLPLIVRVPEGSACGDWLQVHSAVP